jgi:hypothetical protein
MKKKQKCCVFRGTWDILGWLEQERAEQYMQVRICTSEYEGRSGYLLIHCIGSRCWIYYGVWRSWCQDATWWGAQRCGAEYGGVVIKSCRIGSYIYIYMLKLNRHDGLCIWTLALKKLSKSHMMSCPKMECRSLWCQYKSQHIPFYRVHFLLNLITLVCPLFGYMVYGDQLISLFLLIMIWLPRG